MMGQLLRNPEVKHTFAAGAILGTLASGLAALWEPRFGLFTLLLSGLFLALFLFSTGRRYQSLRDMSQKIDEILHDDSAALTLDGHAEGELAILTSEIQKMTLRLREQQQNLLEDKLYLADSIADISHQIRTPLTSINLLVQLLREPDLSPQRKGEILRELRKMLSRIDWLITTLLKISKLDAGTVQLRKETLSMQELLQKAVEPLLIPMELREQELRLHAEGGFAGDIHWTCEAIGNIVKNCMEHTPTGGTITLTAAENPLFYEIVMEDTGSGIPPEDLPHIFERFYKGQNSDNNSFGIGLALARMIAAQQDGTLKAENVPGGGARFTMRFYKGTV